MTDPSATGSSGDVGSTRPADGRARGLGVVRATHAAETLRLYAGDWARFARFCAERGHRALPASAETVICFLQQGQSGRAALARRLAAVDHRHRAHGVPAPGDDPSVRRALKHARAAVPRPARRRSRSPDSLRDLAAQSGARDLAGLRDRALLLLLAAGLSRRDVVGLQAERLRFGEDGLKLPVGDAVRVVARAPRQDHCPVRAVEAWLAASATRYGPVFRKVTRWGTVEPHPLGTDAIRLILARRSA